MIRGAIFDLDGTILDSMSVWENAAGMFLKSVGIEADSRLGKTMVAMSMAEGAVFLKDKYRLDMDVDAIIAGINHTIEKFYYHQVQLKEGVAQFLNGMKQVGIKMVIATASDRQVAERALERLNVINNFDRIFTCTEIGAGKVKPDIYLAAAKYMGTLPKDTWVFEDALHAIMTAKNAGFWTVGVYDVSSIDNWDEIKRVSDIYLRKLDDIHIFVEKALSEMF